MNSRRRSSNISGRLALAALGVSVALAGVAKAGYSTINPNPNDEVPQASILAHVYGGTFSTAPDGVDYNNGTISAVRVSDYAPTPLNTDNPGPNNTDQLWEDSAVYANAKAVWAEESQTFGFVKGASGGTYQKLFSVTGDDYNVSGSASIPDPTGSIFRFASTNPFGLETSLPSDNTDGKDHMVTFEIKGLNDNYTTWLLFFDDYGDNGKDADFDYQDLVVELKTIPAGQSAAIPEPGSLMVAAGAGLMLLRRQRTAK